MKKLIYLSCLCLSTFMIAQETASKIPNDAVVVATVKGENLLQLISMDEINESFIGKNILKDINRKNDQNYRSLEDFGLNLNASSHYFHQINDSINYHTFIVPIHNVAKFEDFVQKQTRDETISINGIRTFEKKGHEAVAWNDTTLIIVKGTLSDRYFEQEEVLERYGLMDEQPYYYEDVIEVIDEVRDAAESWDVEDAAEAVEEVVIEEAVVEEVVNEEFVVKDLESRDEYSEEIIEVNDYYNDDYNDIYNSNRTIKTDLKKEWSLQQAINILTQPVSQSIIHNKAYQSSLDRDAEATLWVRDFGMLYDNLLGNMSYGMFTGLNIGGMYSNTSLVAKLYAENDKMQLTTAYTVNDQWAKSYKRIASKKLNRKFLKYINEDRMVGYMSYAIDTKAALQEYPAMMKTMYGNMPKYGEEASLAIDLFELLLDEEAVAKVFPGDMLFLLSGISEKEMTYTSYDYDDNYEYTEVEKTRTETVPDFLLMVSSEDSRLLKKLISYGENKKVVNFNNGFFSLKIPKSPLDIHFIIKDDILFMGTSLTEMDKIVNGNFDAKLSKKHRKLMTKSNYTMFLSGKQLAENIPVKEMSNKEMDKMNYLIRNAADAYITFSKIKGNVIEAEMVIEIPAKEENALKYMFKIMEEFVK